LRQITIRELEQIMHECAGWAQPLDEAADQSFDELGYDSLALLQTSSRIKRDYGVQLSEDLLAEMKTPSKLVDAINALLRET
jgi:minimal PKS acyl carrier protein